MELLKLKNTYRENNIFQFGHVPLSFKDYDIKLKLAENLIVTVGEKVLENDPVIDIFHDVMVFLINVMNGRENPQYPYNAKKLCLFNV